MLAKLYLPELQSQPVLRRPGVQQQELGSLETAQVRLLWTDNCFK